MDTFNSRRRRKPRGNATPHGQDDEQVVTSLRVILSEAKDRFLRLVPHICPLLADVGFLQTGKSRAPRAALKLETPKS
jgi:hypothetical protein